MRSKIVSLSKNEDFKSILNGEKISNKYSTIFFKTMQELLNQEEIVVAIDIITKPISTK